MSYQNRISGQDVPTGAGKGAMLRGLPVESYTSGTEQSRWVNITQPPAIRPDSEWSTDLSSTDICDSFQNNASMSHIPGRILTISMPRSIGRQKTK
jgi:hypothetical protein